MPFSARPSHEALIPSQKRPRSAGKPTYNILGETSCFPQLPDESRKIENIARGEVESAGPPYVIRQEGAPPGGISQQDDQFLLRKDRTWVLNFAVFVTPPEERDLNFLYGNIAEAMDMLQSLSGKPRVEEKWPEGKPRAEILADMQSTNSRIFSRIRNSKGGRNTSTTERQDGGLFEVLSSP